ncbi:MAG: FAD:protein FMN transferase [Candidatus Howiella sp.]|jgi:thiamine biosynthesis lipoprotein
MKPKFFKTLLVLLVVLCLSFAGCKSGMPTCSRTGYYFNTVVTLTLYNGGGEAALDSAFALCAEYEVLFSRTDPDSALYALNRASGASVALDSELEAVLRTARAWAEKTGGRFDPTVAPLSDLWDFGSGGRLPSEKEIASALARVGYEKLVLAEDGVSLRDGAAVDLGGIAKGYIGDRLRENLMENGVSAGLIDLGGNILCIGGRPGRDAFTVGVKNPQNTAALAAVVEVRDMAVSTSGGYERCFTESGKTYHHILDPTTGYPAESDLASATVICPDGETADVLSTVCFLYGREGALALIESLPDAEALLVTTSGEVVCTSGLGPGGIPVTVK